MPKHIYTDYRLSETQKQMMRSIVNGWGGRYYSKVTSECLVSRALIQPRGEVFELTESGRKWADKYL